MALVLEPTAPPPPTPPPVSQLADGAPAPAAPAAEKKGKAPDTAGIEQFLKVQIGSDRYKEIASKAKEDAPPPKEEDETTPKRGPDGKFLKPDKKAAKEPPKAADKPKAPAAKPAHFKPKAQPAAEPLTAEQIVAASAEGAARALAGAAKDKTAADDKKPKAPELPPEEQEKVEILTKMEELNPKKYQGLAEKYTKSLSALETYAKQWEKEHPGQPFDEDSPEHADFFKDNDVDWSDLDYQKAIARIVADDVNKGTKAETDEKLAELTRAETLRQKQTEIATEQNTAALTYWREMGDDFADVLSPDGKLNMAKIGEIQKADPEGFAIRVQAAEALDIEVAEIYKLYNGLVKNDPEHSPLHRHVNQFAAAKEHELAAKPTQEKLNQEGKSFVPAARWFAMTKAEREQHWTFSARDLAFMRANDLSTVTAKRVELNEQRHRDWAKARGIQLENPDAKPESPSAGGESRLAAVGGNGQEKAPAAHETFLQKQLHG